MTGIPTWILYVVLASAGVWAHLDGDDHAAVPIAFCLIALGACDLLVLWLQHRRRRAGR